MVKMARTAGLSLALCLVAAAPAHAAFLPDLRVDLAPATAGASPPLRATITHRATDTPIERFTLNLPAGFTPAGAPGAASCALAALRAGTCAADTRIGTFIGYLGAAPFGGPIHKTSGDTFAFFVSVLGGAVGQTVQGSVVQRANGALDIRIDQLPALPITTLALGFGGGALSPIRAPEQCGNYTIDGKFTSRTGELAIDRMLMPISGCTGTPTVLVTNVRLSKKRFESGGSTYATRAMIAWWASHAVDHTDVLIERRRRGSWRLVGTLTGTGNAGENLLRWDGRVNNRRLKPGRYRVGIQPAGSHPAKRVRFRIVRG